MKNQTELVVVTDLAILEEVFVHSVGTTDASHVAAVLGRLPSYETGALLERPLLLAAFGEALLTHERGIGRSVLDRIHSRGASVVPSSETNIQEVGGQALAHIVVSGIKAALANEDWTNVVQLCRTLVRFVQLRREYADLLNLTLLDIMAVVGILEAPFAHAYPDIQAGKGMAPTREVLKGLSCFGVVAALLEVTDAAGLEVSSCALLYGSAHYCAWPTWRTLGTAIARDLRRARLVLVRLQSDRKAPHGAAEHFLRLIAQAEASK